MNLTTGNTPTFGQVIGEARKRKGWSQKQLADSLRNEDDKPISPQYVNDLERDRRNPPSSMLLDQLAQQLELSRDYLDYIAGHIPTSIRWMSADPQQVEAAFQAFRKALSDKQ